QKVSFIGKLDLKQNIVSKDFKPDKLVRSPLGIIFLDSEKRRKVVVIGSLFFTYLILAGAERFFIEFLRVNTKYLFGLSGSQLISLIMIFIGAWFLNHPVSQPQEIESEK
ncbi:MAG: hypothetical protein HOE46_04510, partial [Candidatus Marinimicrobia bacterium]|nr:hypothetical protein [Candidatus Neomarinimicrobiota bacterium]